MGGNGNAPHATPGGCRIIERPTVYRKQRPFARTAMRAAFVKAKHYLDNGGF